MSADSCRRFSKDARPSASRPRPFRASAVIDTVVVPARRLRPTSVTQPAPLDVADKSFRAKDW